MSDYVLEVGSKGFDRLQFINDVFGEYSRNFLKRAGLSEGQHVLEIGCGTGSMTSWIAQQVGDTGRVIAVDASEKQIEIASRAAQDAGITNISFLCSAVEALEIDGDPVDLVYSRLLLMHLRDAEFVLTHLKKYLKQGGAIACEEPHASSLETVPYNENIERLNQLFIQLGKLQGFDFDIGEKLLSLLSSAGYTHLHGCFVQPIISMDEAINFVLMNAAELAPVAERTGIIGGDEARGIISALQHTAHEERAYYVFPRQAQFFGYKF